MALAILAAAAEDPTLLDPVRATIRTWFDAARSDARDEHLADVGIDPATAIGMIAVMGAINLAAELFRASTFGLERMLYGMGLVRTYAWILILATDGVIEQPLKFLGIIEDSLDMMYTNGAVGVGLIYTYIPLMVLPIYASLEKLDFRLIEAAHDLYANRIEVVKQVIIPLAKPGIVAGSILVLIPSLGAFVAPNLLGGGKKLMMGSLIQVQFASARNWPFGAALSIFLLALVMIALLYQARVSARRREEAGER